jgi:hypothetical protein
MSYAGASHDHRESDTPSQQVGAPTESPMGATVRLKSIRFGSNAKFACASELAPRG